MLLALVISIILLIAALIVRMWWLALGLYILSGILQIKCDKRTPYTNRPSYSFSPGLRYLMIGPLAFAVVCYSPRIFIL